MPSGSDPSNYPVRLLGEGKTDADFLYEFAKRLKISQKLFVEEYAQPDEDSGGKTKLTEKVKALVAAPEFQDQSTTILAVMRDADEGPARAFQSVTMSFEKNNLPSPATPQTLSEPGYLGIRTAVLVVPPDGPGALENMILSALREDPIMGCIDQQFEELLTCLETHNAPLKQSKHDKARYQMYLAARAGEITTDVALKQSWFPWDSPQFAPVRNFLNMLATTAP